MEIIKNFGINPYLLVAQIVNFLIILYLLKRFAFKPILKILAKREKEIELGLKNAEEAKLALEKAVEEEKKILRKAQTESQKILSEAKNQADKMADEIRTQTREQVAQMLDEAKQQNSRSEKEMEKRVAVYAAELAVRMLQESITGVFSEQEQKEAIEKLAKNLKVKKE